MSTVPNVIKTQAVRTCYRRATQGPDGEYGFGGGYRPTDRIGHAVLDTVVSLCDALDEAKELLERWMTPMEDIHDVLSLCEETEAFIGRRS